jgi:bacterioferritin
MCDFFVAIRASLYRIVAMNGNPKVIDALNRALREELTAINQYFVHAEMYENWGYERLSKQIKKQSIDEMKHAEALLERLFYLDGAPTMAPLSLSLGGNVKEMIESDLKLEIGAIASYNEAIRIATEEKDHGTRELFARLLKIEEEHADWLETQLHEIEDVGYERYLGIQTKEE